MKWLGRWIVKQIQKAAEEDRPNEQVYSTLSVGSKVRARDDIESDDGLNITVRKAVGGKIVTFLHYDHKSDRHHRKLYVIPDDLDFERELGKMITLESMRG